ncbi:MAG: DUF4440 domain-containing protein [Kiloniellales bacterium]|nr:DUF4440 domain-containing protein [Kiloniellales bacterium]
MVVTSDTQSIRDIVKANNDRWNAAFNSGDAVAVATLYTTEATVLPHTHDVVTGAESIQGFWKSVIDAGFKDHRIEILDVHVKGDLTYEIAKWAATGPGEDGEPQSFGGSLVNVYERQGDDGWKCCLHIWN